MDVDGDPLVRVALGLLAAAFITMGLVVVIVVVVETAGVICRLLRRGKMTDSLLEDIPDAPYEELLRAAAAGGGGGDDDDGDATCVICQAAYEVGQRCLLLPACKHMFHRACVAAWLRKRATCPLCRATVVVVAAVPEQRQLDDAEWNIV